MIIIEKMNNESYSGERKMPDDLMFCLKRQAVAEPEYQGPEIDHLMPTYQFSFNTPGNHLKDA